MPNAPRREQSDRAWYRPSTDSVGMPSRDLFHSSEEYYSTLFHELTHSTGHASRVGREGIEQLNTFGSESYSKEELIAEMGAAMLCGVTGISPATIPNSAAYLQCWITRLRGDSKLLVSAASAAQKAADYIRNTSAKSERSHYRKRGDLMSRTSSNEYRDGILFNRYDYARQAWVADGKCVKLQATLDLIR